MEKNIAGISCCIALCLPVPHRHCNLQIEAVFITAFTYCLRIILGSSLSISAFCYYCYGDQRSLRVIWGLAEGSDGYSC